VLQLREIKEAFEAHEPIQNVKKIQDYALVYFEDRNDSVQPMNALIGNKLLCN
jgi:hypothetical protein